MSTLVLSIPFQVITSYCWWGPQESWLYKTRHTIGMQEKHLNIVGFLWKICKNKIYQTTVAICKHLSCTTPFRPNYCVKSVKNILSINYFLFQFCILISRTGPCHQSYPARILIMLVLTGCWPHIQGVNGPVKDVFESRWGSEHSITGLKRDSTTLLDCSCSTVRTLLPSLSRTSKNKWMLYQGKFAKWEMGVDVGGTGGG